MMNEDHDKERIESVNQMLIELGSGNFSCRVERSDRNDDVDAMIGSANMMGRELGVLFRHRPFVNYGESYEHLAEMSFILDNNFHICSLTPRTFDILLYSGEEILGRPLTDFLMEESKPVWKNFLSRISDSREYEHALILFFKARQFFIVPTVCLVSTLCYPPDSYRDGPESIVVTTTRTVKVREEKENELRREIRKEDDDLYPNNIPAVILGDSDLEKLEKVQEYLARHPEEPGFSIKRLAKTFHINDFKLKYGFKQLYGTTLFRYLQDKRLEKANQLVQHSGTSLKDIAAQTGFKSAAHFSRVFKDKYGYSPSKLRKLFRGKSD